MYIDRYTFVSPEGFTYRVSVKNNAHRDFNIHQKEKNHTGISHRDFAQGFSKKFYRDFTGIFHRDFVGGFSLRFPKILRRKNRK